jgi:hypothetical protein
MDDFLEPYWNLDQVRSWAETRNPDAVRFAAISKEGKPKLGSQIASFCAAAALAQNDRDVGAELWATSGWTRPSRFVPTPIDQMNADEAGLPIWLVISDKDVLIQWPKPQHADALLELWMAAAKSERAAMNELVHAYSGNKGDFKSDPRLGQLSEELRHVAIDYFSAPEAHGPPHVFNRGTFPTIRYLKHLFQTGALAAIANSSGEPKAYALTKEDWGGLEIECGGDLQRLGVWRRRKASSSGEGDFENVRVERNAVLRLFPVEPPVVNKALAAVGRPAPRPIGNARKPLKPVAAAEALRRIFPDGRPLLTLDQLLGRLENEAPEVGLICKRTLSSAIPKAWPSAKQN